MAVCSGMELMAERSVGVAEAPGVVSGAACIGSGGHRPSSAWENSEAQGQRAVSRADGGDQGSDSECDEVRSLSLSEDGPVVSKSAAARAKKERCVEAPDPIAMLSDGQYSATSTDHTPNDSDHSAAATRLDIGHSGERSNSKSPSHELLTDFLSPILSKLNVGESYRLEVVPEQADSPSGISGQRPSATQVTATKVKALRGGAHSTMEALNLAQVKLPAETDTQRPLSARSDVSIGSACSAFSSFSSPSCSTSDTVSPRNPNRSLTGTVSMPSLKMRNR